MTDLFIRDQSRDDHLAKFGAGDIDMIISPVDQKLVVVAQVNGIHACARCHEGFVHEPGNRHYPVEFNPGGHGTRVLVHACCVAPIKVFISRGGNFIERVERAHQARRFLTKATKGLPAPENR